MTKAIKKKSLLKIKRRIFIMGCIFCMMFSTVTFAKTYVGNVPSMKVTSGELTVRGNASYTYGLFKDKLYCFATISGDDARNTIKDGPLNGIKMTTNKTKTVVKAAVYGTSNKRAKAVSGKVSTKNSYATVEYYVDGCCKKRITLRGR